MIVNAEYPTLSTSSNFTAAGHLQAAGVLLQQHAAQVLAGRQARKLQALAEIFDVLAIKLDNLTQYERRLA